MEYIPTELWLLMIADLNDAKETIKITIVSKLFMRSIKNHNWYFCVKIKNDIDLEYVLNNYKFKNLVINKKCEVNKFIDKLAKCHTLDLYRTNITDASVKLLCSYNVMVHK